MALTPEDKELITLLMQGHTARMESSYEIINTKLDGINSRLDKLNGRVYKAEEQINSAIQERGANRQKQEDYFNKIADHEKKLNNLEVASITHNLNCPVMPKLRILEDSQLTNKAVKRWVFLAVGMTATIIGAIFSLLKISGIV